MTDEMFGGHSRPQRESTLLYAREGSTLRPAQMTIASGRRARS